MILSLEDRIFAPERLRRLFVIFILTYYVVLGISLITSGYGRPTASGYPELIDFSWIWTSGQAVVSGNGARVYDFSYFSTLQIAVFGHQGSAGAGFAYVYPPSLLLYLAPLGLLPLFSALVAWLSTTFLFCLAALRKVTARPLGTVLGAVPSAVSWNIKLGHTGFLATGLLALSLGLLERSPFAGGLVLGLLSYKPQLGVVFPIVLVAAGQWRAVLGAALTTLLLVALSSLLFGFGVWLEFLGNIGSMLSTMHGDPLMVATLQTAYGFATWLGCPASAARILHLLLALPVVTTICVIWRRPVPYTLKAAALALGAVIATPYLLAYDLVALAVPTGFLLEEMRRTGFLPGERLALLAAWLILFASMLPVGVLGFLILFAVILRRVFLHLDTAASPGPADAAMTG